MKNRRTYSRIHSYAKAVFLFYDMIGYIRDVSETGFRVEILAEKLPETGKTMHTTIIAHPDLDIDPFNVLAAVRWLKRNDPTIAVGLEVVSFSTLRGKELYKTLVDIFREPVA